MSAPGRAVLALLAAPLLASACAGGRTDGARAVAALGARALPAGSVVAPLASGMRVLPDPGPPASGPLESATGFSSRSAARAAAAPADVADVYARVAPSVVLVRTPQGFGTGFVVDPSGWIITNHHVIASAPFVAASKAQQVTVYFGTLVDELMTIDDTGRRAVVFSASEALDLALLHVVDPLPAPAPRAIELAPSGARPGEDCLAIGHPVAAMLWSVRRCQVAGVGDWPRGMIDVVMRRMALEEAERAQLDAALARSPHRKVVVSTCGISPGDSGGPLLDRDGRLLGVTFAIPRAADREETGVSVDKFSYHVHGDEVRAFLANRPAAPQIVPPDPWPAARLAVAADLDEDGSAETILFGNRPGGPMVGFMADLDEGSAAELTPERLGAPDFTEVWDFEFALHLQPTPRAFYDTDGDGRVDLVLGDVDGNDVAESVLVLRDGAWTVEDGGGRRLIDPSLFRDAAMAGRLEQVLAAMKQ